MIITKIRVQEEHPMASGSLMWPLSPCDLNLNSSAGENGYLIKQSVGLDPPSLTAVVIGFDAAGIPIMDSEPEDREIALRIQLTPKLGQTPSSLRDDLYKFMSRSVLVSLMDGSIIIGQTTGYIQQFEASHFTNQPEVQMTIECEDGYFYGPNKIVIPTSLLTTTNPVITYEDGSAPTGFELQFIATANRANISITGHSKGWHTGTGTVDNSFIVTYPILTGDVITLSTHPPDRRITLLRGATTYDLSGYLNAGAVWPKLYSGVNAFGWNLNTGVTWISASYIPRYWGV